jgi:hypothetical protein
LRPLLIGDAPIEAERPDRFGRQQLSGEAVKLLGGYPVGGIEGSYRLNPDGDAIKGNAHCVGGVVGLQGNLLVP